MNIDSLKITQIILVRFDEIPLNKLIHRPNLERLAKFFKFNNAEATQVNAENAAILYQHGVHRNDSGEHIISRLVLENRRILLEMDGTSKDADAFFASLTSFLADLAGRTEGKYLQPIVKSEESEIIARLEFPIEKLISPTYLHFVESIVASEASSDIAEATVKPASLAFNVEYLVKDSSLSDYRISLSQKEFTVEPRRGYPLADQMYYSKAPFDTNTHIELLEELEKTISQIE
jgi:hypothetical protein